MNRARTLSCCLLLMAAEVACRTPSPDTTTVKDAASGNGLMIDRIERENLDLSPLPSILLSEVWTDVGTKPSGAQLQIKVLSGVLAGALPKLQGADISMILSDSFGVSQQQAKAMLAALASSGDETLAAGLAAKLKAVIDKDPTTLDRFPTIRLSEMGNIQKALFASGKYQANPPAPRAFRLKALDTPFVVRAKGCVLPQASVEPFMPEVGLDKRWYPITRSVTPCFHDNNEHIARALNILSNLVAGERPSIEVSFDADGDASAAQKIRIDSYEELLALFAQAGIQTEVYTTRQVADFLGLYYTTGGSVRTIRTTVWFAAEVNGTLLRVPSEHSEIELLFHKNGRRLAQVRYYLGTPKKGFENTPSYWRPHFEVDALWSKAEHESVQAVAPAELVTKAKDLLYGAARSMLAYQAVHDRFQLPANAYGVFICSDSVVTAVAASETAATGRISQRRVTQAFPLLRMDRFTPPGGQEIDVQGMLAKLAGIDAVDFNHIYPTDIALQRQTDALKARLLKAYPPSVDERYSLYPEFVSQLKASVRQ